jgi:hypothetical protein
MPRVPLAIDLTRHRFRKAHSRRAFAAHASWRQRRTQTKVTTKPFAGQDGVRIDVLPLSVKARAA